MAHELLSVKLCELDEKLGRLHSRIQFSQTSDRESLARETKLIRRECEEEQQSLSRRLKFSRSEMAMKKWKKRSEGPGMKWKAARKRCLRRNGCCWQNTVWILPARLRTGRF